MNPEIPDESNPTMREFPLTPAQAYTFLVACMSLPHDTLLELGVFSNYQEIIDLLQWPEGYVEVPEETKQALYAMFTLPGEELTSRSEEIEGIVDPFV